MKKNDDKIIIEMIVLISTHTLVKYHEFRACKYYFNNLVNLVFIVDNKYNYIELYINVTCRLVKIIIIIIIIINEDANVKRKDKENKDEILLINRIDRSVNYTLD